MAREPESTRDSGQTPRYGEKRLKKTNLRHQITEPGEPECLEEDVQPDHSRQIFHLTKGTPISEVRKWLAFAWVFVFTLTLIGLFVLVLVGTPALQLGAWVTVTTATGTKASLSFRYYFKSIRS